MPWKVIWWGPEEWAAFDRNWAEYSTRVRNAMEKERILSPVEAEAMTDEQLLLIPNFGKKSLREIREMEGNRDYDNSDFLLLTGGGVFTVS